MNKMIIKLFITQIILLAIFTGCKKNDTDVNYSLSFSRRALEYVKLTEGKYLIYKDSATAALDSVVVTKSKLETYLQPKIPGYLTPAYYHENFVLELTKYMGSASSEWFYGNASLVLATMPFASSDTEAVRLYGQYGSPDFIFSASSQSNLSLLVEGVTYNNVVETISDAGVDINHPAYHYDTYYWAKGIGIIKRREITTGGTIKTYTLLRHN